MKRWSVTNERVAEVQRPTRCIQPAHHARSLRSARGDEERRVCSGVTRAATSKEAGMGNHDARAQRARKGVITQLVVTYQRHHAHAR